MTFNPDIFLSHLAQTSPRPFLISVEKAKGIYLYSPDGKQYMDMISGIGVANIGHCHPRVVKAIQEQAEKHLHVMAYGEFIQATPNRLAEKLISLLPPSLNCIYPVNSGTEANEGALKLAKRYTERTEIISCHKSYHGSTHGSLSVSGNENKRNAFRPLLPDVRLIEFNNINEVKFITEETSCVIMETIQGDAGVRIPDKSYLQAVRKRCSETGALLILDEIQCGMGRSGTLFAFEQFGIFPDILTIAKAFGGGLPIGAFISDKKIMDSLSHGPPLGHITTFGGNPVCCAAALATLEVLEEENILPPVESKGQLIDSLLQHSRIKAKRRIGLMFAFDFETPEEVNQVVSYCKERGVIVYWFLSNPCSLRMAPPLTITEAEIRKACAIILQAIQSL